MGWVRINPRCREMLHQKGLVAAADFLRLPGVILSGHPDRHVFKVEDGILQGVFLKKEHRVRWRDRLTNAWAGFGLVSKSTREAEILEKLARAGIPCPKVLAYGENRGRAFVLLREQTGLTDIRHYLQEHPDQRQVVARALGLELAKMHAAGFVHGDLYTKHVLVGPGPRFCFLDWQRGRRRKTLSWACRCRDLAALDATCPDSMATDRTRLACLRAYVHGLAGPPLKTWARAVRRLNGKLQQKPRIRSLRRLPLTPGTQALVWLDGEALCLTRTFRDEIGSRIPDWLRFRSPATSSLEQSQISLADGRAANLIQRTVNSFARWLASWWGNTPAPEVQQAALIFRLERHDVACPKLLAFGRRRLGPWREHSFLLTEMPPTEGSLLDLLARPLPCSERAKRLQQAGDLLRRLHEAGYVLGNQAADFAHRCGVQKHGPLVLTRVDGLERRTGPWRELAVLDLPKLGSRYVLRGPQTMRFFLGYLRTPRLTPAGRVLARKVLARLATEVAR